MRKLQGLMIAMALALFAPAAFANAPLYTNHLGQTVPPTGVVCVNPTSGDLESCGGSGGGGTSDATAAKQDTGNTSLASILAGIGAIGDAAWSSGNATIIGALKGLYAVTDGLETLIGSTNTKLDTLHADVGTTLHGDVDGLEGLSGALTETAPATDTASSGLNGRLQRVAQRLTSLIAALGSPLQAGGAVTVSSSALPTGAALDASVDGLEGQTGSLTETAPATDTASSGLNGRAQRVAQRLTSLIAALGSPLQAGGNVVVTASPAAAATGGAVPANATYMGLNNGGNLIGAIGDPCQTVAHSYTPINIVTATTTRIVAPTSAKKTYICSLMLYPAAADSIGIVEGTGGTCGSGTAGVIGGATAAAGIVAAAGAGFVTGTGVNAVAATAGTNVDLCLITSAAVQLSGVAVWVQQ